MFVSQVFSADIDFDRILCEINGFGDILSHCVAFQ